MKNQVKSSIRFFANTRLKPKTIFWKGELVKCYRLYCQINFDRKNVQQPVFIDDEIVWVSPDLEQIEQIDYVKSKVLHFETAVKRTIMIFSYRNPDFDLTGIAGLMQNSLRTVSILALNAPISFYLECNSLNVFTCLEILKNDFADMTVLDWLDGGSKEFETAIRDKYKLNAASTFPKLIDHLIKEAGHAKP